MTTRTARPAVLCALALMIAGCAPFATYPPVEGSVAIAKPQFEPIPELMADAILFCHERYGDGGQIVFNLPEGTPDGVYQRVIKHLGDARPMTADDVNAFHVVIVRARGLDAEVDLIYPRSDGVAQLATINFRRKLRTYVVKGTRLWRIHVDTPPAYYVPRESDAPEEAVVVQPTDEDA